MMNSRRGLILTSAVALFFSTSCSPSSTSTTASLLQSNPGQLFCALQTSGGGAIVAALVDASVSTNPSTAAVAPIAVLATNQTKQFVDDACAQAAKNTSAVAGIAVSPPPATAIVPLVAVAVATLAK